MTGKASWGVAGTVRRPLSVHQVKYHAHELQRSYASDHVRKLVGPLFDAQVEPKPHQIDAALSACQMPFLDGLILADEVGLGMCSTRKEALRWSQRAGEEEDCTRSDRIKMREDIDRDLAALALAKLGDALT